MVTGEGDALLGEWVATLQRVGGTPEVAIGRSLLRRYAERHRHYHNADHLAAVLSAVDQLAAEAAQPDVVRLAAWYHDAVYEPTRDDNERRSAELAERELRRLGLTDETVARVGALVRVTQTHRPPPGDADAEVLCDADLAVLAAPVAEYEEYVARVRREYRHLDDETWRVGRSAVLRGLLDRHELFRTPVGRRWEPVARGNITAELAALGDPSAGAARQR